MDVLNFVVILLQILQITLGVQQWKKLAISKAYQDLKLLSTSIDVAVAVQFYPVTTTQHWTRIYCATECIERTDCGAFNFYSNTSHYTCELFKDNYCVPSSRRFSLVVWQGSSIWEKLSDGVTKSCLDQAFATVPATELCATVFTVCIGTWPNCNDCVQSCIDCQNRYRYGGYAQCTLWPGGPSYPPIYASCWDDMTYIMKRRVDLGSGNVIENYMMSLADMNRLANLNVYNRLQFYVQAGGKELYGHYMNPYIDASGTLRNLTYLNSIPTDGIDSLGLNGGVLTPAPFISINDNTNRCGSFWQFKPTNNLSCPGGGVGLFGAVAKDANGLVIDTGMHWPNAGPDKHCILFNKM